MNKQQFEVWKRQKEREYNKELETLQNNLSTRGILFSGYRTKAEQDLKDKYNDEIEIMRLGTSESKNSEHVAIEMTESSKNNLFVNSNIYGKVKIAGNGNSFIKTNIHTLKKEHPFWFWLAVAGSIASIVALLLVFVPYFK